MSFRTRFPFEPQPPLSPLIVKVCSFDPLTSAGSMAFMLEDGASPAPLDFTGVNPGDFSIADGSAVWTLVNFTSIIGDLVTFQTTLDFQVGSELFLNYTATGTRPKANNGMELQDFVGFPVT